MVDALQADDVAVRRDQQLIVAGVSMHAAYGSVTAIIGPNGAGKSTLLRALTGILPYSGSVRVEGTEVAGMPPRQRAQKLAYVPQHTGLLSSISAREVVAQGRFAHAHGFRRFAPDTSDPRIDGALERVQALHLKHRAFNKLSGGEQRRVLLARALATEARVVLLDEPTAGLDVAHVLRFHALVRSLAAQGLAVVCVLHDLMDVALYADRAILLSEGKLVCAGDAREVVRSSDVERVYGVRMADEVVPPFRLLGDAP